MSAPVVAITAYDEQFYEHLPFLFPHADAKPWFASDTVKAGRSAFQNSTLQVAYLIIRVARSRSRHRPDDRISTMRRSMPSSSPREASSRTS